MEQHGAHSSPSSTGSPPPRRGRGPLIFGLLFLAGAVGLGVSGILERKKAEAELVVATEQAAIPTVVTIKPIPNTKTEDLILPGDVEAWYEAPIYARVNGYVKMWYKDIGAKVKTGDLLAEIDTPDLDEQYAEAKAALARAIADQKLADITAERWKKLLASDSVSRENADVKAYDAEAKHAVVAQAQANVARLEALEGFKKIVAPFDGVVTARRTDIGALVNAGSGPTPELFTVADIHKMRVYVRIPQQYIPRIREGMDAVLTLPGHPEETFPAKLMTTANAVSPESRTLLVELWADNPDGKLQPGTYANVDFKLPPPPSSFRIPVSALIFQQNGLQVAVLDQEHHRAILRDVKVGLDLGKDVDIIAGLKEGDIVINSPPDSLSNGDLVRVAGENEKKGAPAAKKEQLSEAGK
jgi:RND family efflux transporter MFP subunit